MSTVALFLLAVVAGVTCVVVGAILGFWLLNRMMLRIFAGG